MSALPYRVELLAGATVPSGGRVDVHVSGTLVAAVEPARERSPAERDAPGVLDLSGYLLLPAAAEPHAHLDKALTFDAIDPPLGDLRSAIDSFEVFALHQGEADIAHRARRALTMMLAAGTTAVRSHVNFFPGPDPLRAARALVALRREVGDLLDLELVALAGPTTADRDIEAALDLGIDMVGGAPHLASDPLADLHRLLDIAHRRGVGVDLHTDESLDGPQTLLAYAQRVRDWDAPTSAGHCVRLGTLSAAELDPVVTAVREAGMGIISLPITNLYLQGWDVPVATPRGLTALRALIDAGVPVAAGADNLRDPFNPLGRADPLETAGLLVTAGHLSVAEAFGAITHQARAVMHLPPAGVAVGARADFMAVRADTLTEAIASAPQDRHVVHAGQLVATTILTSEVAVGAQS